MHCLSLRSTRTPSAVRLSRAALVPLASLSIFALACSSSDKAEEAEQTNALSPATYEAGSSTFCITDATRGFDPTAEIGDGQRVLIVEAWYPTEPAVATAPSARKARFGDYFADDAELLLRSERALLQTTGFAPEVIEQHMALAPEQFDVPRGSYRDAPVADGSFPVVIYSHGTLQQRFTNDTMAENLARHGYIVLSPEHTGNDALAPLGAYCGSAMSAAGVLPAAIADNPAFDRPRLEYRGQTFDPFFLAPAAAGEMPVINPREVGLTMDRVGDFRATLAALPGELGGLGAAADSSRVAIIGYSRGAMHGLVGAELMPEVLASVALVGGTPLRFYAKDAEAAPINQALAAATGGTRDTLDSLTKPVVDLIGGEDTRRKASTDAAVGVYDLPSASNPSPIVLDSFQTTSSDFGAVVRIEDIDHFDLVDDPFVIAYRATEGMQRSGAFDAQKSYQVRPLEQRQRIRDFYVLATLDRFLKGADTGASFTATPFADEGVSVMLGAR